MTGSEKRAWVYGLAWLGGGMAAGAMAIWLVTLIRWDWPADRAEQQLTILANALYGMICLMALVTLGLSIRNAIRNIKGSVGAASFEANGHDGHGQ
jgi:hypothetical protein